jgi:hypothetical protein
MAAPGRNSAKISVLAYPTSAQPRHKVSPTGELHYIIENGVQLTGMPPFTLPHEDSRGVRVHYAFIYDEVQDSQRVQLVSSG